MKIMPRFSAGVMCDAPVNLIELCSFTYTKVLASFCPSLNVQIIEAEINLCFSPLYIMKSGKQ